MRMFTSLGCLLFALLACFSTGATADILIETGNWQNVSPKTVLTNVRANYLEDMIHVSYSKQIPEDSQVFVVRRHSTYWIKPAYGQGRVRITVPVEFYLSSWDVKALERELQRLGIKVKPRPVPRPKPVVSG